jgi:hypothetical protein
LTLLQSVLRLLLLCCCDPVWAGRCWKLLLLLVAMAAKGCLRWRQTTVLPLQA